MEGDDERLMKGRVEEGAMWVCAPRVTQMATSWSRLLWLNRRENADDQGVNLNEEHGRPGKQGWFSLGNGCACPKSDVKYFQVPRPEQIIEWRFGLPNSRMKSNSGNHNKTCCERHAQMKSQAKSPQPLVSTLSYLCCKPSATVFRTLGMCEPAARPLPVICIRFQPSGGQADARLPTSNDIM